MVRTGTPIALIPNEAARPLVLRCVVGTVFWWACLSVGTTAAGAWAGEGTPRPSEFEIGDEPSPAGRPGVLLLRTGRVIDGRIVVSGSNYIVKKPTGEMFIPQSMVTIRKSSLREVFQHVAQEAEETPDGQMELGRWCVSVQLLPEAQRSFQRALALEPERDDIRTQLRRVESLIERPDGDTAKSPVKLMPTLPEASGKTSPSHRPLGKTSATLSLVPPVPLRWGEAESLAGLSRDAAHRYMSRVQPVLVNNCALAGCHHQEATNGLRLLRVSVGADLSRSSEQNVLALSGFIQFDDLPRSPLLSKLADKSHGVRYARPLFTGPKGDEQRKELYDWVASLKSQKGLRQLVESRTPRGEAASRTNASITTSSSDPDGDSPAIGATAPRDVPRRPSNPRSGSGSPPPAIHDPFANLSGARGGSKEPKRTSDPFSPDRFHRRP